MKISPLVKTVLLLSALLLGACAQTPPQQDTAAANIDTAAAEQPKAVDKEITGPLAPLAWLGGCWKGSVNQRDYREHWLPLRGDMMLGASHIVLGDKTQDYQFLRMEVRDDAVHYVIAVPNDKEHRFKLSGETTDRDDTIYTFDNVEDAFPQIVSYRKASGGWMYITVEGKLNGADRKVIYPIRRVDCGSGEFLSN
ncbi:MAG: DUF6265 family protein [Burkholderiales bacterium]|jgi:hypothetical protein|nr:DUF6265 family protein [Burkholderiales bacterium]